MRTWTFLLLAGALALGPAPTSAGEGDPLLSKFDASFRARLLLASPAEGGQDTVVDYYVRSRNPRATASWLREHDGRVGTIAKDILTVRSLVSVLRPLAASNDVVALELAHPVHARLDKSLAAIRADKVQSGAAPLDRAYKGKGIVVGVIDYGLDFTHAAFKSGNATRLLGLWDQNGAGTPPAGFAYGTLCTPMQIQGGACMVASTDAHGTLVTGIAAGSTFAGVKGAPLTGVAPESDLVFVNLGGVASTSVCDGASFILATAAAAGKPAVVNMSLGQHTGPHDGSGMAEDCLNNLAGPGKILVAAAGNEGEGNTVPGGATAVAVHVHGSATPTALRIPFCSIVPEWAHGEVWFDAGAQATLRIGVDQGGGNIVFGDSVVSSGNAVSRTLKVGGKDVGPVTLSAGPGMGSVGFAWDIGDADLDKSENDLNWVVEIASGAGSLPFDGYIDTTGGAGFVTNQAGVTVDSRQTIGFPADAKNVIATASVVTRNEYPTLMGPLSVVDRNGQQLTVGALSGFSSRGPLRTTKFVTTSKPDIAAPGEKIGSALHKSSPVTADVAKAAPDGVLFSQGTSMASPHAAGVIALMLSKNPQLTVDEVRAIWKTHSATPQGVTLPNDDFGVGVVDAFASVQNARASEPLDAGPDTGTPDSSNADSSAPVPDATIAIDAASDAASEGDAGPGNATPSGCSCGVGREPAPAWEGLLVLVGLLRKRKGRVSGCRAASE